MTSRRKQREAEPASERAPAQRRRAIASQVREARDRLTSTSGTRPAFDYELLRLFAHNRLSASLVVLLLAGTVGFLSSLSTGALQPGTWMRAALARLRARTWPPAASRGCAPAAWPGTEVPGPGRGRGGVRSTD